MLSGLLLCQPVSAIEFSLFGDTSLVKDQDEPVTFRLGEVDLMAAQELGEVSNATVEIVFEDSGHGFEVDVERFYVSYSASDLLNVSAGRFHTPIGFWNYNFHHGLLIQDTITRPFFLEFEDAHEGIFPVHMVGILIDGLYSGDSYDLDYKLALVNSPSIDTSGATHEGAHELEVNNDQDRSDSKSIVFHSGFVNEAETFGFGFSAMFNHIVESGDTHDAATGDEPLLEQGEVLFEQTVLGLDLQYRKEKVYFYAEYFVSQYQDSQEINAVDLQANPETYTSTTYYAQLGYHVSERASAAFRYEALDFDENATYLSLLNIEPQTRSVLALRYNLEESSGLRLEASRINYDSGATATHMGIQWFFLVF